jgi:hypothetical protein
MAEQRDGTAMKRRGILAAAAAVVAGIAMKQASQPVAANTDGQPLLIAMDNSEASRSTALQWTGGSLAQDAALLVHDGGTRPSFTAMLGGIASAGKAQNGVYGAGGYGVMGEPTTHVGIGVHGHVPPGGLLATVAVQGYNESTGVAPGNIGSIGVVGWCDSPYGIGVQGNSSTYYAVQGMTDSGVGVVGDVAAGGSGTSNIGVIGRVGVVAANARSNTVALYGQNKSTGANGIGVYGSSDGGTGVYGSTSTGKYGVYGIAGSAQGAGGVVGVATQAGTIGFAGAAFAPATDAGYFTGNVSVFGSLAVSGAKHAVVMGQDGKYRGMYAVESPECWFEDFGTGTLVNGKADIMLDALFAQHIHTDSYHVFLTERDTHHQLNVTNLHASGFTVTADVEGAALKGKKVSDLNGTFSWRVVAKRADIKGERLPIWQMPTPAFTKPEPPPPAPPPPPTKKP